MNIEPLGPVLSHGLKTDPTRPMRSRLMRIRDGIYADSWPLIRIQNPAFNAVRFNVQPLYAFKSHTVKSVPWIMICLNDVTLTHCNADESTHPQHLSHLIRLRL